MWSEMITNGKNAGGKLMEHYDLRVIEDCLVFSYEVECPHYPKEVPAVCTPKQKPSSRRERKKAKQMAKIKRLFLRMLLVMLAPFAILADAVMAAVSCFMSFAISPIRRRAKYLPVLGTFSGFVLLTVIFQFL